MNPAGASARSRRALAALLAGLLLLAVLVTARRIEERRALRRAWPTYQGTLTLAGLGAPVKVVRDRRGVPHLRARTERDAWFALGFVHAQDRLAQMEWLRRAARGRTAEAIGRDGLATDRLARTLGLGSLADAEAERLQPATLRTLEAYAAGVNARLARIRDGATRPPLALMRRRVTPEDWKPADSVAVVKLAAWSLDGAVEESLVLWELIEHLGGFGALPFFPPDAAGRLLPQGPERSVRARPDSRSLAALRQATGLVGRSVGSSAWLVPPARSASGRPLLAADLHLEPTVPALLHQAHLSAPGFERAGASIPGVPVFWVGHNGRVAWAGVHARAMVIDLYAESLHPRDPDRYHDGRSWRSLATREETIAVRGGEPVALRVRATRHGPLLDGLLAGDGKQGEPIAVAWPGAQPGNGIAALLRAARSTTAEEFRRALAAHHEPVLAFLFADAAGRGGLQVAGFVPQRPVPSGLVPMPGRSSWTEWREPLPFERLPRATLEADGAWLVAADGGLPEPAADGPAIEWLWRSGERTHRIEALLDEAASAGPLDALDLVDMQQDVRSAVGPERARLALALAGSEDTLPREAREVVGLLHAWDGRADAGSVAAAAYHAFLMRLVREVLAEPLGPERLERYLRLRTASPETLMGSLLVAARDGEPGDAGLAEPERVRGAVRTALRETGLALLVELGPNRERWTWGRLHPLRFRPFGWPEASTGERLASRPYGGDGVTVAVGEYDPVRPFAVRVASVFRFVVDTANLEIALTSLAPGASEHPGHAARDAGLDSWLEGRPGLLATHPVLIEETARERLRLEPAS